jgi:hypothetical protein
MMQINAESAHVNPMYWWMGQVVDESCWQDNSNDKIHKRDDVHGWGKRYKVRIFGRDTKVKDVPDDQLEMAEIIYPVTAGSGHGGSYQTANIRQGSYVVGFYKDGINGTEPIIFGCLGNNSQTRLAAENPEEGFIPRDGYFGVKNKKVSNKDLYTKGDPQSTNNAKQEQNSETRDLFIQRADGSTSNVVLKTLECEGPGGEIKGIQGAIQKALAAIARIKLAANSTIDTAQSITANVSRIVDSAVSFITGLVKKLVEKARGYVLKKLENGLKDVGQALFPNARYGFSKVAEQSTDTLGCVFKKIIDGLLALVKGLFSGLVDKFINAPLCAAEKFVGDIISSILGDIVDGIQSVLNAINGFLSTIQNIASIAFQILDFVSGLLKFLKCEDTPSCEYKDRWSLWNGSKEVAAAETFFDEILSSIDDGSESGPPCNTSQLPCGPPSINITGGGGSGAVGNAVVGIAGEILGVDISSFGSGFTSTPTIEVSDQCGNGGGAQIFPITTPSGGNGNGGSAGSGGSGISGSEGDTVGGADPSIDFRNDPNGIEITGIVVDPNNSGAGYLPVPDGSTGGDGYPISDPDDVIVTSDEAPFWQIFPPETTGTVGPGDQVFAPIGTTIEVFADNGDVTETIIGRGPTIPTIIDTGGTFTVPIPGAGIDTQNPIVIQIGDQNTIPDLLQAIAGDEVTAQDLINIINETSAPITIQTGDATILGGINDILSQRNPVTIQIGEINKILVPQSIEAGTYNVVVTLDDVIINNPGTEYSPGDTIRVTPDTGVELRPTFNSLGSLKKVDIISKGNSFNTMPTIEIVSKTGVNADIWPVFKIQRVEDLQLIEPGQKIITVVDCVGKYNLPNK